MMMMMMMIIVPCITRPRSHPGGTSCCR